MFCHNCGRQLRVCYRGKNKKIGYIDCSLARGKEHKCRTCNYNYNKFEQKILNITRNMVQTYGDKNALIKIYKEYTNNYKDLIEKEEYNIKNITDKINEISRKLDKMYFDNLNGIITDDDYFRYSKEFVEEREKLKEEQKYIDDKIKIIANKKKNITQNENCVNIIESFLEIEKPSKKMLYELIDRIELDEYKNIYIYFNFSELNVRLTK